MHLRKQVKDEAKARKAKGAHKEAPSKSSLQTVPGWELTVGIEIHAQLNTQRKLFSPASLKEDADIPNKHVAYFDLALPGAQPLFQPATLVPAIRAALALNCAIQPVSRFDRKHYFHWDQPSGYQITQYYEPFARGGFLTLTEDDFADDVRDALLSEINVSIQQVQMEQDTAKTVAQPGGVHWLDFNRVGVPLIEIITGPELHHPATAAAFVRKVQALLYAVDACTSGMEQGGLRADINVSVRRTHGAPTGQLGVRTEIKNLSSFRAVEDAIIAERDRQIALITEAEKNGQSPDEAARAVKSETRGYTPQPGGVGATHRLRGKEGEVDYRYMPDPDLAPVVIDDNLVKYLGLTLGVLPDDERASLTSDYGLSTADAAALMQGAGERAEYYYQVVDAVEQILLLSGCDEKVRPFVANWVLHQLGRLADGDASADTFVDVGCLAAILAYRYQGRITASVAKELLFAVYRQEVADVTAFIEREGLWFDEISDEEYKELAVQALAGEEKTLKLFQKYEATGGQGKYPHGKLQYLMGKVLRSGPDGRTDPQSAEKAVKEAITAFLQV